eukprot:m.472261 g.472261  ORF g.472261 m.472261 type:complete len:80 (+) comp32385_c0_seq1:282-521(+)
MPELACIERDRCTRHVDDRLVISRERFSRKPSELHNQVVDALHKLRIRRRATDQGMEDSDTIAAVAALGVKATRDDAGE